MLTASTATAAATTAAGVADSQHSAAAPGFQAAAVLPIHAPAHVPAAPVGDIDRRHSPLQDIDGSYAAFSDAGS
jgi:hypothetical protein